MSFTEHLAYQEKQALLRDHATRYPRRVMVETGLYNGRGSGMSMSDLFGVYHAIDTMAANITRAVQNHPAGIYHYGDSAELLPRVLSDIHEPAFFWLDAHYWQADEFGPDQVGAPIVAELEAIRAWPWAAASVVLIDDVRLMGVEKGWPTLDQVRAATGGAWSLVIADDIVRCLPH